MGLYLHLERALDLIKREPDYRKWGPLIDAIEDEEAREVCRNWLREEAKRRQLHARNNEARNRRAA